MSPEEIPEPVTREFQAWADRVLTASVPPVAALAMGLVALAGWRWFWAALAALMLMGCGLVLGTLRFIHDHGLGGR